MYFLWAMVLLIQHLYPTKFLLIGGGVGVAPLLYFGKLCKERGISVTFLLGARTASDLLELDEFRKYGETFVTTEDGSMAKKAMLPIILY